MSYSGKLALYGGLVCLSFCFAASYRQVCDKSKCKGPIRVYEELKCKPIYAKEGDCCAVSYDCSHLQSRSKDKCYANGHEYNDGQSLRKEDRANPCDVGCFCSTGSKESPNFICAVVDCYFQLVKQGCYFKRKLGSCCGGEEVCPKPNEKPIVCEYNSSVYRDGDMFYTDDNQLCQCSKEYLGKNVPPYCIKNSCGIELRNSREILQNCAPLFSHDFQPRKACPFVYRCQNSNDVVIRKAGNEKCNSVEVSDNMKCKFGNLTMNIGDELNQGTGYNSVCVNCTCEVPPTPTCRRLPASECDATKHPRFDA